MSRRLAPNRRALRATATMVAVVMAFLATLSISMSTPAHALEEARPAAHELLAQGDVSAQADAGQPGAGKSHVVHGHVCAAHCAAHGLTAPPQFEVLGAPALTNASWPAQRSFTVHADRIFALERPPRA